MEVRTQDALGWGGEFWAVEVTGNIRIPPDLRSTLTALELPDCKGERNMARKDHSLI